MSERIKPVTATATGFIQYNSPQIIQQFPIFGNPLIRVRDIIGPMPAIYKLRTLELLRYKKIFPANDADGAYADLWVDRDRAEAALKSGKLMEISDA